MAQLPALVLNGTSWNDLDFKWILVGLYWIPSPVISFLELLFALLHTPMLRSEASEESPVSLHWEVLEGPRKSSEVLGTPRKS